LRVFFLLHPFALNGEAQYSQPGRSRLNAERPGLVYLSIFPVIPPIARVVPGNYSIVVEKTGFKQVRRVNLVIAVNEAAVADLTLEVGQINETVSIEAGAAVVQSQSVEISGLVSERRVKELPLNGRNFIKLVQLAPGAGDPGSSNNPSINGSRIVANSYTVDGVGSNDERLATGFVGINGSNTDLGTNVPNLISTEAIQEYRINTSNADASVRMTMTVKLGRLRSVRTAARHGKRR
jgi:hypothetical protein